MADSPCSSAQCSPKTLNDICGKLQELQDGQARAEERMDNLVLSFKALLRALEGLTAYFAHSTKQPRQYQSTTQPCSSNAEQPKTRTDAVASTTLTGSYPQFNAGRRLVDTGELLEIILLELSSEDLFLAQRASRQFRSVIDRSRPLQLQLFLAVQPAAAVSKSILLNPIITRSAILQHIPLYFDKEKMALAYCFREGRIRICCTAATMQKDEVTGEAWVELKLITPYLPYSTTWRGERRVGPFGAGSWKQMCLSQPPCPVKWRLTIAEKYQEHRYSGLVSSQPTMDALLDALAAGAVIDEGEY